MTITMVHPAEVELEATRHPRREQRIASAIRLEVCGFNPYGRFFTERTLTSNISDSGCQFQLRVEVEKKSVVALRVIGHRNGCELDSRPILFQVERVEPQSGGWSLGLSKLQSGPVWCEESARRSALAPGF
ncbi:MAG TPA: hypothetical protein VK795_07960 [Terriglobales bacterium]|nr:hypothetical protein [Terriglobales bacterium]